MLRGLRAANVLAALTTVTLSASSARSDPQPTSPAQAPVVQASVVVVTVVGGGEAQPALEGALRELLARLHLQMNMADAPPESVLARVQIDLGSPGQATVLVTDGRTGEVRAHRIIPRDSSTSIMREEIAHAVQSAVESALIVEERAAQAPPPAPPPPAPVAPVVTAPAPVVREAPAPVPPHRSLFALDLTALGGAGPFANNVGPVFRVGGGVLASSRGMLRPSFGVTAFYTVPFQSQTSLVSSYANLASVRAMPAIELLHASWIALDVGAGLGIDVLSVQPRSGSLTQLNLDGASSRVDAIVAGAVSARAALAPSVVLVLSANADVDLASRHYVLEEGTSAVAVFEPWRVRPTLFAGLEFTAIGEGRFTRPPVQEAR